MTILSRQQLWTAGRRILDSVSSDFDSMPNASTTDYYSAGYLDSSGSDSDSTTADSALFDSDSFGSDSDPTTAGSAFV